MNYGRAVDGTLVAINASTRDPAIDAGDQRRAVVLLIAAGLHDTRPWGPAERAMAADIAQAIGLTPTPPPLIPAGTGLSGGRRATLRRLRLAAEAARQETAP